MIHTALLQTMTTDPGGPGHPPDHDTCAADCAAAADKAHVCVQGIKVKDSESKRKIKALLRDEAAIKKAQNTMDEDEEGWEEVQGAELEAMAV